MGFTPPIPIQLSMGAFFDNSCLLMVNGYSCWKQGSQNEEEQVLMLCLTKTTVCSPSFSKSLISTSCKEDCNMVMKITKSF